LADVTKKDAAEREKVPTAVCPPGANVRRKTLLTGLATRHQE
jgi:hypothetical protein